MTNSEEILRIAINLLSGGLWAVSIKFFVEGDNIRALVMIAYVICLRMFVPGRKGDE